MLKGEMDKPNAECRAFSGDIQKSCTLVFSHGLSPTRAATTVRVRDGKTLTTDGRFVETKEQLGSIYLIEVNDLNDAIWVASRIPSARFGNIEVRPLRA